MAELIRSTAELSIGGLVGGRYVLRELIGSGATGSVYRAHDSIVDRPVAVKVMANLEGNGGNSKAILNEARLAGSLSHTNIVSVHDVGSVEMEDGSGPNPYIVMEFVKGASLHEHEVSGMEEIVSIATDVARGLSHAHSRGIVHRDLKPENIMIGSDGMAKVTDFGLARSADNRISVDGSISGTVYYMAPEVALAEPVDSRSDLYALGVILYELTTGELPFFDSDPLAVISQHIHAPLVPPAARSERIPPGLNSLIVDLLAKQPAERPASAAVVVDRLDDSYEVNSSFEASAEVAVLERIARGRHVGRQKELAAAKAAWRDAVAGDGSTTLITGEPGIGKSRLLRELRTLSEVSGARYLLGEAFQEGGGAFSPFIQIISSMVPWVKKNRESIADYVIADLLPLSIGIRSEFPEVDIPEYVSGEAKQQRLFDAVLSLVTILAEQQPVMLALEDVHWADHGSLSLALHLARNSQGSRVLVVMTYREIELSRGKPFARLLNELNRARLARTIKLARFDIEETGELLRILFRQTVSEEFIEAIHRHSEGNPFFMEEACKGLIESGELYHEEGRWQRPEIGDLIVPQSVRLAVQDRLGHLPDGAYESLLLASFVGRSFEYETILDLVGVPESELVGHLESAERAQLIRESGGGKAVVFRFDHALVPATLRESVGVLKRRLIHQRVAKSLVKSGSDRYDQIAKHFGQGMDHVNQFDYLLKGAEVANGRSAYTDADLMVREALEIAAESGDPRGEMLAYEQLARIHSNSGAEKIVEQAVPKVLSAWKAIPEKERNRDEGLRALTFCAELRRWGFRVNESSDITNAALELIRVGEDEELRSRLLTARSFAELFMVDARDADVKQARADAKEALEIAELLENPDLKSAAIDAMVGVVELFYDFERSLELQAQKVEVVETLTWREAADVLGNVGISLTKLGRFAEAEEYFAKEERALRFKSPRSELFRFNFDNSLYWAWGRIDKVLETMDEEVEYYSGAQLRYGVIENVTDRLGAQLQMRNLVAEIVGSELIERSALTSRGIVLKPEGSGSGGYFTQVAIIPALCELDRVEEAARIAAELESSDRSSLPPFLVDTYRLALASPRVFLADPEGLRMTGNILRGDLGMQMVPALAEARWKRGELLNRLDRPKDALEELDNAIELYEQMGVLFQAGACRRAKGESLSMLGRLDEAAVEFVEAVSFFEKSGAMFSVGKTERVASRFLGGTLPGGWGSSC